MKMNEKIEIMLGRKRIRKTDFAESVGVTYRAFANYMNGSRRPRADTLNKIAEQLQLTPEFLKDDSQELELTIEERFIKRVCASDADKAQAAQFLAQSRGLFAGNSLNDEDKEALLKCLMEIYEDSRKNSEN
ncbi:MAG: helix-turn-helix transcriptional regulator [Oscillospiraceae bacterium]|nr:helix-turn-helix transcriptional regulator [Oscillospiraceae bacterium]